MNKNEVFEELSEQIMSMDEEIRMKLVLRILALTIYENNKNGNEEGTVMDLELSFSDELSIVSKNELIFK